MRGAKQTNDLDIGHAMKKQILFVCMGNICRSPMAESICKHLLKEERYASDLQCDSAGTSAYHVGEEADVRARACLSKRGLPMPSRARQVEQSDFTTFDYLLAVDRHNYDKLLALAPANASARVLCIGDYDPETPGADVPDPYYGEQNGFEAVYAQLTRSIRAFLDHLKGDLA